MEEFSLGAAVTPGPWIPLPLKQPLSAAILAESLDGGQAFRWSQDPATATWTGVWKDNVVSLKLEGSRLSYTSPSGTSAEQICHYLGIEEALEAHALLPLRTDPVLQSLTTRWSGLSLLRQPPEETLLTFLCSSNKRIVQIKAMVAALAERLGKPIAGSPFFQLPDWPSLAETKEQALLECRLGYRAKSVLGTARFLAENPGFLESIHQLPYAQAHSELKKLPGVGPKVADCVLLFGYGKGEAFPVDTWIERTLKQHYPDLASFSREQLATFGRYHFGKGAGLAQQWFFAEARNPSAGLRSN